MGKKPIIILTLLFTLIFIGFYLFSKKNRIEEKITTTTQKIDQIIENIAPQPTKILESGLPDKHLTKTAFIEQAPEKNWAEPWQDACEEAALLTVDYFYKNQTPPVEEQRDAILKMLDFEKNAGFTNDVNISQMAAISAEYLGYKPKIVDNPTVEDIKKSISQNIPVIIPVAGKILFKENKHFKSGGPYYHNLTILGYDDTKQKFIVHDVGTQFGAYFQYSYDLLMESIHDFPLSGKKEDILIGAKKILILTP
ncbi:MAG: C39 family peptidase [Candidatus Shapirobacteria bacterium]